MVYQGPGLNLKDELSKIPEFDNNIQYHWRNNEKTRQIELTYFLGYRAGGQSGTYTFKTNKMIHEWGDDYIKQVIDDYKNHLRSLDRRGRVEP